MTDTPKILVLDIETAPILAHVWRIWKENVNINQIQEDWYVLAWCAKWLGSEEVIYMDQRREKNMENDSRIVKELWKLIDEADMTITHNGKQFDHKRLNSRFLYHGLKPPSSYRMIDTKEIASKFFGFTSNKLEFLTDKLNKKYKKLKHEKFPGYELWRECLKGNWEAWREMEKYNKHDVLALEELYGILKPWDRDTNFFVYQDDIRCRCGSEDWKKNGWHYAQTRKYQRYKCTDCGYEWRDVRATRCSRFTSTVTR